MSVNTQLDWNKMRPFTMSRILDLLRLARTNRKVTPEHAMRAMMVSQDRALELLEQAKDMGFIKKESEIQYSILKKGGKFFESAKTNDKTTMDYILSEYHPYYLVKSQLIKESGNIDEIKIKTGLNEVEVEIILRLLKYIRDDLCVSNEKYYISRKEPLNPSHFLEALKEAYYELNRKSIWGRKKRYVRTDEIARLICTKILITPQNFSTLLEKASKENSMFEISYEKSGDAFFPPPSPFRRKSLQDCYITIRGDQR